MNNLNKARGNRIIFEMCFAMVTTTTRNIQIAAQTLQLETQVLASATKLKTGRKICCSLFSKTLEKNHIKAAT
jgi:hypothetical protein